jgi:hypothetical protein
VIDQRKAASWLLIESEGTYGIHGKCRIAGGSGSCGLCKRSVTWEIVYGRAAPLGIR